MRTRILTLIAVSIIIPLAVAAQGGTWVWLNGDSSSALANPVYGTMGVPSVNNTPGGLYEASNWTDQQGNFWIFGGLNGSEYGDLWKYDPTAKTWCWIKGPGQPNLGGTYGTMGVASPTNQPGCRSWGSVAWTDNNGDFWLFGGYGYDGSGNYGSLNDLWRYNVTNNEWTWMNGSNTTNAEGSYGTILVSSATNQPPARWESNSAWVDENNNLWFFGGYNDLGFDDMWKYNISTGQWTWMKGNTIPGGAGNFGSIGVEAASNLPPGRGSYTRWKDAEGNFYIFGGFTNDNVTWSDVWKFNPVSNNWTWIAGPNTSGSQGSYLDYCQWEGEPMARSENRTASITSCTNVFLTMGGGTSSNWGETLNDLWIFDISTLQWKWVSGTNVISDPGSYGVMGVPLASNLPQARQGEAVWIDENGNVWIFGGAGSNGGYINDMWKFTPDQACLQTNLSSGINYQLNSDPICKGDTALLTLHNLSNGHISPSGTALWVDTSLVKLFPDTTTTYLITGASSCRANDTARVTLTVTRPGILNYFLSDSQLCQGTSATLQLIDQGNVSISPLSGVSWIDSTTASLSPAATTTYKIKGFSTLCSVPDSAQITLQVTPHAPITASVPDTFLCNGATAIGTFTGISNLQVTSLYYYYNGYHLIDSFHVAFTPEYSGGYAITGTTSCGGPFTDTVNFTIAGSGNLSYSINKTDICRGDTALLTVNGASHISIIPNTGVNWIDSTHALLFPDTDITYNIYGSTGCGGYDSATIALQIIQPGEVNYSVDPYVCYGYNTTLYVYGLNNVVITPYQYFYYTDSADGYAYIYPYSTTTYTVMGQSVCGGYDSTHFTITAGAYPSYGFNQSFICAGDTAVFTASGVSNLQINPNVGVFWRDSAYAVLQPSVTTTYYITGQTCEGPVDDSVTLRVGAPGVASYTLSSPGGVCLGSDELLYVYGISNPVINPYSYPYMVDTTSYYYYLYPTGNTVYRVTGNGNCGGKDTLYVPVTVSSINSSYSVNRTDICPGGNSFVHLYGLNNISITPPVNVVWIDSSFDSSHVFLAPDTTTTYTITGTGCDGYTSTFNITVRVINPAQVTYTVNPDTLCGSGYATIYLYGLREGTVNVTPYNYPYWTDSTDAYFESYFTSTTTYTITGQSVCGLRDSTQVTVYVSNSVNSAPADRSICKGGSTDISVAGITGAYLSPITGVYWLDSTDIKLNPDTTTTYTLYGTGCEGEIYNSFTVYVIDSGSLNYSVDTSVCTGDYDYLTVSGASNLHISPFVSFSTEDSVNYYAYLYPNSTTTYTLIASTVCNQTDTARFTVDVSSYPTVNISTSTICSGDSAILTLSGLSNVTVTPTTGLTWLSATEASLKPSVTTTYFVEGYSPCEGYYTQDYTVQVNPSNGLSYSGDSVICPGGSIYLTVYSSYTPNITPYSYFYSFGNDEYYTYLYPLANTAYIITGYSPCNGKLDTAIFNAYVTSTGFYTLSSPSVCGNDSTELSLLGFSYVDITPTTGVYWQNPATAWLSPTVTTTYDISGYTLCGGYYDQEITIPVSSPLVTLTRNDSVICSGDSAQFCATPGFSSYIWNTGQITDCIETRNAGDYYVTVSNASGCTAESNHLSLIVHPEPPVAVSAIGDTLRVYNSISQQWYFNGSAIPGATGHTYIATGNGDYTVQVTDSNGCVISSSVIALGIEVIDPDMVRVYPNPLGEGYWNVDVTEQLLGSEVIIYDDRGRIVYLDRLRSLHTEILMTAADGIYIMRISSSGGQVMKKLVKM